MYYICLRKQNKRQNFKYINKQANMPELYDEKYYRVYI